VTQPAVIYIRSDSTLADCNTYCANRDYAVAGVVVDPEGLRWTDALQLVQAGRAEVIVVHGPADPPPERIPRIEVATDAPAVRRGQRRVRRLARD
jgi:hypothetical protein